MTPKPLMVALILFLSVLAGCGEEPQPVQKAAPKTLSEQPAPQQTRPQPAARTAAWPFMSADQSLGNVAENLTSRNFMLIFDASGSMNESQCAGSSRKIDVAKKAVVAWSQSVPADANLGLYAFHAGGIMTLPLSAGDRDQFMNSVMKLQPGGNTPLGSAMLHSYQALTKQGQQQLGYGEYTIVVVTDGIANNVDRLRSAVATILKNSPITIYSIGFCIGPQHSLNQPGLTLYKSAGNPEALAQGLKEVLAETEVFDESEFSQ